MTSMELQLIHDQGLFRVLNRVTTSTQWQPWFHVSSVVEQRKMLSIKDPFPLAANEGGLR